MSTTSQRYRGSPGASDPRRWAHLIFVLGGFMGAWLLYHVVFSSWDIIWGSWPQLVPRAGEGTSLVVATMLALAGTIYAWRRKDWFRFCTEVVTEISQVTWPTRSETRQATIVVLVTTMLSSTLLWGMDRLWSTVTNWLYAV